MSNIVTTAAAEDIMSILSVNYGTVGLDLFSNMEPDDPDNCVTIYDTGSDKQPLLDMCWEYPTVQVRVRRRAGDHRGCKDRALSLMNELHGYVGSVGSVQYASIRISNGPISLGDDDRGRPRYVFNLGIQRTLVV